MNRLKTKLLWLMSVTALVVLTGAVGVPVGIVGGSIPNGKVVVELEGLPQSGHNIIQEGVFGVIEMEGFALTSSPGEPMLPHKIHDILIPPDAIDTTVKLRIVSAKKKILDGTYDIKPAGPDVTRIDDQMVEVWGNGKVIANGKNVNVYQSDADFPTSVVKILSISRMRKWKFVRVDFSPLQYNPVTRKLTLTESIEIEISYDKSAVSPAAITMTDTVLDDVASERFLNFTQQKDSYQQDTVSPASDDPSQPPYDYVIITTNAINNNSLILNAFITHKQNLGHSVYLAKYEVDIIGLAGQAPNNRAEKIRQWLINNYSSYSIKYVLLIGDPSPFESAGGEGDIPMKMCHPESNNNINNVAQTPTDFFYADLTGNWDIDADQLYGEWDPDGDGVGWSGDFPRTLGVDFTEEVYVGRIPVYDANYITLDNILQKIIDYETEPGNLGWRAKVLLPMGFQHATGPYDGAQLAEQMRNDYLNASGYSSWRMYQQGTAYAADNSVYVSDEELRGSPGAFLPPQDTVLNEWSNAVYGINCWWAHGSATSASVGYSPNHWDNTLFRSSYCSSLDDDHPAFTYQCSCTNGQPETSNNLQYSILKKGGIGTVSATRLSWFNTGVGYGQFNGSTTNSGIGYEYVKRLTQNMDDGIALYQTKSSMTPGSPTRLMNWYDFNLYGCPAVNIDLPEISEIKWEQPPDETQDGIDIRCDQDGAFPRLLADDFNCVSTGPITKVIFWGSWMNDEKGEINKVHLSIHSDLSVDDPCNLEDYSMPKDLLWERNFLANDINETSFATVDPREWFWDPVAGDPSPTQYADQVIWKYEIPIARSEAFIQQGDPCNPVIYWLDISVDIDSSAAMPKFGWKTSSEHWNDDAVWSGDDGAHWNELRYPPEHPNDYQSIDLSFVIITGEKTPEDIKWSQPPVPWEEEGVYVGWDEESHDKLPRMVADDFRCDSNKPVTAIRWWGSFDEWRDIELPDELPESFYLTIWTDVPAGVDEDYSHPGHIIWDNDCSTYEIRYYGMEYDPNLQTIDLAKFEFYQELDPCDYWRQPTDSGIYWLGIAAVYGDEIGDPYNPWGWETREHFFMDDAVRFLGWPQPDTTYPSTMFKPIKLYEETWDLSFELISKEKEPPPKPVIRHLKWSQPPIEIDPTAQTPTYCGWDETSFTIDPAAGWKMVADDFRCIGSMPITSIHWWGSYYNWDSNELPLQQPTAWRIGFWTNVKKGVEGFNYSRPEKLLKQFDVQFDDVGIEFSGYDQFPERPSDACFQYAVILDEDDYFWQENFIDDTSDRVFWISIAAIYQGGATPNNPWGWKTRAWHWMDDAVIMDISSDPTEGSSVAPHLITPIKYQGKSFDVSFELDTDPNYIKWEQDYTGIRHWPHYEDEKSIFDEQLPDDERIVADDWRCLKRTPITAITWWGSYIGYGFEACSQSQLMRLPVSPDYFKLKMWTDVPASKAARTIAAGSTDNFVYVYDGAGNLLWSYNTGTDVASVAVSANGTYIAAGGLGGKLYLFTRDGTKLWEKNITVQGSGGGGMGTESKSVAISADGEYIVAGGLNNLYVYKKDGTLHWSHAGRETCVSISPNGDYIAACVKYGNAHLFSTASSAPLWTKTNIDSFYIATSDPGYVVVSEKGNQIFLFDAAGNQIWSYSDTKWTNEYIRVDMTQDGLSLVAVNDDPGDNPGCILAYMNDLKDGTAGWNAADGTPVWRFDPLGGPGDSDFYSVAISGDGEYIVTGGLGSSYIFSKASNVPLQTINTKTSSAHDLTYGGQYGACGNQQGDLYYLSKDSGTPVWTKTIGQKVHTVAIASYGFSHPNEVIWEYDTGDYDEVLVGYDKHPEGEPNEPVFRYSVRLPEENWFQQPDYEGIFWLSVQAVYDVNRPEYPWGWTNHEHAFNDDAVAGYLIDGSTGEIEWAELYDQTGATEDMSFVLFTDPDECSGCANYNCDARVNFLDYSDFADDWYWTGPAGGYNNSDLDCDGDVDLYDADIFTQQWLQYCP